VQSVFQGDEVGLADVGGGEAEQDTQRYVEELNGGGGVAFDVEVQAGFEAEPAERADLAGASGRDPRVGHQLLQDGAQVRAGGGRFGVGAPVEGDGEGVAAGAGAPVDGGLGGVGAGLQVFDALGGVAGGEP